MFACNYWPIYERIFCEEVASLKTQQSFVKSLLKSAATDQSEKKVKKMKKKGSVIVWDERFSPNIRILHKLP